MPRHRTLLGSGSVLAALAENATAQLAEAFDSVTCVRTDLEPPMVIKEAAVVADYVASWAGFYQGRGGPALGGRRRGRASVGQAVMDRDGAIVVSGDLAAFVCR